jgi:hypothetical protein
MPCNKDDNAEKLWLLRTMFRLSFEWSAHRLNKQQIISYGLPKEVNSCCAVLFVNQLNVPGLNSNFSKEGNSQFYTAHGAYAGIIPHCRSISQLSATNWSGCGSHWWGKVPHCIVVNVYEGNFICWTFWIQTTVWKIKYVHKINVINWCNLIQAGCLYRQDRKSD